MILNTIESTSRNISLYKSGEPVFVYRVLISDWRLVAIELNFRIIKNMYRDIKG